MEGETEFKRLQRENGRRNEPGSGSGTGDSDFLKEMEIAKALSLESLELDRIRREKMSAEARSGQVVVHRHRGRSSPGPQPLSSGGGGCDAVKKSASGRDLTAENFGTAKPDPRSRPRPGHVDKFGPPIEVLPLQPPPPAQPRRQTSQTSQLSASSSDTQDQDLISFVAPDSIAQLSKPDGDFDPLLSGELASFSFQAPPTSAPPKPPPPTTFSNASFTSFESSSMTAVCVRPTQQVKFPLTPWGFPQSTLPRGYAPPLPFMPHSFVAPPHSNPTPPTMPPRPAPTPPSMQPRLAPVTLTPPSNPAPPSMQTRTAPTSLAPTMPMLMSALTTIAPPMTRSAPSTITPPTSVSTPPMMPPRPTPAPPSMLSRPAPSALAPPIPALPGAASKGRISLSAVPPAPPPSVYASGDGCILKAIEKKSDDNLIDFSFFEAFGSSADTSPGRDGGDWMKSFDPLRAEEDPKAGWSSNSEYSRLWEFKSSCSSGGEETEFAAGDDAARDPTPPPVPVRKQSKSERTEDATEDGCAAEEAPVELRSCKNGARGMSFHQQRCSRVYKSLKAMSRAAVTPISEYEAFRDTLVRLREGFTHDDVLTNAGLVISPNLESLQAEETSVTLCVYSAFAVDRPVQFACDVNTSVEHVISQIACTLFDNITSINLENYVLKVHGKTEYFSTESALIDYEYVHYCLKFDEVVRLTFLDTDTLLKPLARTARDDETDVDIAVSSLIPRSSHAVSPNEFSILLETLEKEIDKLKSDAEEGRGKTLRPKSVIQALMAICSKVYEVASKEVMDSVQYLMFLVNYFSSVAVFEDLPPEREAVYLSRIDSTISFDDIKKLPSSPNIRMTLLHLTLEKVNEAVRILLNTFCRCFFVNYEVPTLASSHSVTDITAFDHVFSFRVYSVHSIRKLPLNTSFDHFVISCELYHGTRPLVDHPVDTKPAALTNCFYEHILFDEFVEIRSVSLCTLPREARLCCTLFGITLVPADAKASEGYAQETREELGWAAFQIFDCNGEMLQGNAMCAMWQPSVDKRLGPAICNVEDPKAPVMLVSFPEFDSTVIFAPVLEDNHSNFSHSLKRDLDTLDGVEKQGLLDTVKNLPYSKNMSDDCERVWGQRYYLYDIPQALPKVLMAAHSWDWSCLPDIYRMIKEWKPMEPIDALELLLPCFPDLEVRKTAVSWIKNLSSDELCDYLPQLVQALKYETYEDSPTARFLLERSLTCIRVMHHLYWLLKQNLDDPYFSRRIHLLMNSLKAVAGKAMRQRIDRQETLMKELTDVGRKVKETKESLRVSTLENALQSTNSFLEDTPTCLPLSPSLEVNGVNINLCSYFPSNALPLKLSFKSIESGAKPIEAIFKNGDDLRQDMLTLQMIRIMDKLWLKEGLNLKIVTFGCIPTATKTGILEMVKEAETLRKIQTEHGLTGSFKDHPIADWLHKYNIPDGDYQQAVENFTLSCAGYSVATYILGICDRHNDNIMIKTSGHIFHIDFGKFLGDSQRLGGIKRDRVPFVLTSDMAYVINGGEKPTDRFHSFIDVCCHAFNAIRKHGNLFLHLVSLMISAGIPGVTTEAVSYIRNALWLDKSENEASMIFAKMIQDSLKSWSTQINFFIHNLAQMRFSGEQACDTLLSFVPRTYSMPSDNKIEKIDVVGYQKLYDPEKYYAYIIKVRRRVDGECFLFRSYAEVFEFYEKLCTGFPRATFSSLRRGYLGRSNIRQAAEKRKADIGTFLQTLWSMADEIKHCDLVYTFFHPLQRDLQEDMQKGTSSATVDSSNRGGSGSSNFLEGFVTGEVKLAIHYKNDSLFVMVMHARNLSSVKGQDPDPYVKTYLIPDVPKNTKRKTKVARKTCHPTFMEMLVYCLPLATVKQRVLQVSIWNNGRVAENMFLGAVEITLGGLELTKQTTDWYQLTNLPRG